MALRLSLKCHPLELLRDAIAADHAGNGVIPAEELSRLDDGKRVAVAGLVLVRQRPGTASGAILMTLEDETGIANLVVWPRVLEQFRSVVMGARLVVAIGKLQREGDLTGILVQVR